MGKIRVAINGYGTIGRRVADAILKQDDLELVGVTKRSPDFRCDEAREKGIPMYALSDAEAFRAKGHDVSGNLTDLLSKADIVVDCAPKHIGAENKEIYLKFPKLKAIFQGGEKDGIAETSFNSHSNYEKAEGKRFVRVVSCNTTALCRVINQLQRFRVRKVRVAVVRRTVDPGESKEALLNSWEPKMGFPSHHAVDVKAIFPDVRISSLAGIAPMTLMHGHMLFAELESKPSKEEVLKILTQNSRIRAVSADNGYLTTAQIKDYAEANGRRGNTYEVCVWKEGIGVDEEGELGMHLAIDQQAIVVPENIDAIRAMFKLMSKAESIEKTDASLGIPEHRKAKAIAIQREHS